MLIMTHPSVYIFDSLNILYRLVGRKIYHKNHQPTNRRRLSVHHGWVLSGLVVGAVCGCGPNKDVWETLENEAKQQSNSEKPRYGLSRESLLAFSCNTTINKYKAKTLNTNNTIINEYTTIINYNTKTQMQNYNRISKQRKQERCNNRQTRHKRVGARHQSARTPQQ